MLSQRFDLAIIDVRIPNRLGDTPRSQGGVELVARVCSNGRYYRPRNIIAITAYEDARAQTSELFADQSIVVVPYDRASNSWETPIVNTIERLLADKEEGKLTYDKDIAIVTALKDPELDAVLRLPFAWNRRHLVNDALEYYEGAIKTSGRSFSAIAMAAPQMGMPAAAVMTARLIQEFRPRFVLMAGIAAGVRGEVSYGDVLIADPSFDQNSGKLKESGGRAIFHPDPLPLRLDAIMNSIARNVVSKQTDLCKIRSDWQGLKPDHELKVVVGPMASGASVLASTGSLNDTLSHWRKLIGLDLETYGVFYAVANYGAPKPLVLSAKAVTDFADLEKDDRWRQYAAYTSANVVNLVIEEIAMLEQTGHSLVG